MKNLFFLFVLIIIAVVPAEEFLVVVDNLVEKTEFHVIEQYGSHYIAITDAEELNILRQRRYSCNVVDNNPRENAYYLVYPLFEERAAIGDAGTILGEFYAHSELEEFQHCFLVKLAKDKEEQFFNLNVTLNYLEFTKMAFNPVIVPVKRSKPAVPKYNPLIQKMVDSVSEDSIRAFIRYLQDTVSSRSARYQSNAEESVPWICQKFRDYGMDSVYMQEVQDYEYAPNPVGIKLGKEFPSYTRYFVFGGHCDAVPHAEVNKGADDNGSGIAATIEAARVMSRFNFKYTIIFMGFNGEEVGFVGSAEFADEAKARGDTIIGTITHDMLGRKTSSANYLRVVYKSDLSGGPEWADVYDEAASTYTDLNYQMMPTTSGWTGSDNASFWRNDYIAFFCIESAYSSNSVNHTIDDTLDCPNGLNDTEFLTQSAQGSIACMAMDSVGDWTGAAVIEEVTDVIDHMAETGSSEIPHVYNSGNNVFINFNAVGSGKPVIIRIYNSTGRIISTLSIDDPQKETHMVIQSGRDYRGNRIAKGIYFIECGNKNKKLVKKIMLTY